MFNDELFDQMRAAYHSDDFTGAGGLNSNASAGEADDDFYAEGEEEEIGTIDGSVDPEEEQASVKQAPVPNANRDGSQTSSRRRRRGTRGSGASSGKVSNSSRSADKGTKRWRSGAIPTAPSFEGDIDTNPYCLRHYRRRLMRWVRITKEYLPPNEQALRAREQLKGEAEIELEETPDEKYDCDEGIGILLADLEHSFGERELFRQGGVIREFESIGRLQGESVTSFVRRFRLLEGKLRDNKVPSYPEEARVVKLLDGLRLDERATSTLLLAAGNRYDMKAIQEAIRIQYPAGMSVTGIPKPAVATNKRSQKAAYTRWNALQASSYEDYGDYGETDYHPDFEQHSYEPQNDGALADEYGTDEVWDDEVEYLFEEEDAGVEVSANAPSEDATVADPMASSLLQAVNALTVTSKQLAEITKARGFYQVRSDHAKGKNSKGKPGGKSKGRGKSNSAASPGKGSGKKGKGTPSRTGSGKGKPGPGSPQQNLEQQRQRLNNAACLGCGSTSHWIKDCPHNNKFSAQLATVGVTLNAEGIPTSDSWMVSAQEKSYLLPELCDGNDGKALVCANPVTENHVLQHSSHVDDALPVPTAPKILIQYADKDAFLMIADTGCQRQVAGVAWHEQRQKEILPLQPLHAQEHCRFSFGPNAGVPSLERLAYPAGLGGAFAVLGVSMVESNAPALFSRPSFEKLGAVPNLLQGVMYYEALGTCSQLFLSPCGHLAIRIDEWPSTVFPWPPANRDMVMEDVWSPDALLLEPTRLQRPAEASQPPPHAECRSSSSMASQMARSHVPHHGVRLSDSASSPALCGSRHAPHPQGQDPQGVLPSPDSNDHVVVDVGGDASIGNAKPFLREQARRMLSSLRPSFLRSREVQDQDMRSVRLEVGHQGRSHASGSAEGISNVQDSSVRRGREAEGTEPHFGRYPLRRLGRGLRWLFPTLLAAGVYDAAAGAQCSFQVPSEARADSGRYDRGGGPQLAAPLRGPATAGGLQLGQGARLHAGGGSSVARAGGVPVGRAGRGREHERSDRVIAELQFSADCPMTVDDHGAQRLKSGSMKRLKGNCRQIRDAWQAENRIYDMQVQRARSMRSFGYDIVEIFGGMVTLEALNCGLRVLQPVDAAHGVRLHTRADYKQLTRLLKERRPFLVVWENLNYTAEQLRDSHAEAIQGISESILELYKEGVHFLLEGSWSAPLWSHPALQTVQGLPGVQLGKGSMCNFSLQGYDGQLLKHDVGWLTSLDELLMRFARSCTGAHQHGLCTESTRPAQLYTPSLCQTLVAGLVDALESRGDERFLPAGNVPRFSWACASEGHVEELRSATTVPAYEVFYLDIDRNEQSWLPLLSEARGRLEGKVSTSAIVKPGTAFFAHIQDLVPWTIHQAQIARNPKMKRVPQNLMSQYAVTHRAAALLLYDGRVKLETEDVRSFTADKFDVPVQYAIFVYGEAPQTDLNLEQNASPDAEPAGRLDPEVRPRVLQPEEELLAHAPGHRDITFDVENGKVPRWVQNALRRLHTNLGHPSNESLVRHLAQAGASGVSLLGAKSLRCSVCARTKPPHQPRPAKAVKSRRFNDRVFLDIVFMKNVNFETFAYLNILDDATTYQVLDFLENRTEECVTQALVRGWLRFFGAPDEMVVDAEGALRGVLFENLVAQSGIQLRFVPPDAHYQLGKCERHGQAAKWIARKLVNQFAAVQLDEMNRVMNMTTWAKNTMIRRCGASPCQWVFGRQPKVPTALLSDPDSVEAKSMLDQSEAFMQLEMVRHEAMKQFLDYEFNQALRRAMLRKNRPFRGPLEIGQKVAYFRHRAQLDGEGTAEGYRQGLIIGLDPGPTGSVWLRNHRGRIVQASREQIRSVEGDELWSPNTDDINALKSTEDDLDQKHAFAFDQRGSGPSQAQDHAIRTTLDPAGQPQREPDNSPLYFPVPAPAQVAEPQQQEHQPSTTPVVYLPPTPALAAPSTPALAAPGPSQSQASTLPALPPISEETAADEPNTRTADHHTVAGQLKLSDKPPSQGTSEAESSSGSRQAEQQRGTKREAQLEPSELRSQTQAETTEMVNSPGNAFVSSSAMLAYCKSCGTQNYGQATTCLRCSAAEFVDDPKLVDNWFDEVEEHEALGRAQDFLYDPYYKRWLDRQPQQAGQFDLPQDWQLNEHHAHETYITGVGQLFRCLPEAALMEQAHLWSVATQAPDGTWEWDHIFEGIDLDSEVVQNCMQELHSQHPPRRRAFIRHGTGNGRRVRDARLQPEHRFLHRHGRHCVHLTGWDGSPPELQPAFESNRFLHVYHVLCEEMAQGRCPMSDSQLAACQADVAYVGEHGVFALKQLHAQMEPSVFNTHTDQVFRREESSDEEEAHDSLEASGRAAKQALKREVPWRSISAEDWPAFVQSLREEWQEWEKWSSCKPVKLQDNEVDPRLILKSRVCYRWKPKDGGKWFKPKARIVIQGYRDPHLPLLTRDAPVLSKTSFVLILQWAACHGVSLHNGDCKSAFLQGLPDVERPEAIFMKPPQDDISLEVNPHWRDKRYVYQLSAPVYGQANAPRRWYLYVVKVLTDQGWSQHTLDPCCFLFIAEQMVVAVLGLHVDDIITCCLPGSDGVLEKVKQSFVWGSEWEKDDFVFVGRRIQRQPDGGFTLDQAHYVADIMMTKITKDPSEKLQEHPELVTEFRSGIGSLQWLAGTTRGDLSAYVSLLQKRHHELTVADLVEVNRVLKYVRATSTATVRIYPFELSKLVFIAYGDSGFGNAPNGKSQGGYVVLISDKQVMLRERQASLVDWKSYRHQRALRSTLAAEAAALDRAQDTASFMACVFTEMVNADYKATSGVPGFEVIPITDARSLWDAVHRLSTTFAEKRVEIDVAGLRESCRNLRWVPTEKQHADALTKMNSALRDSFRKWMASPVVTLVESKSAAEAVDDNSKWRNDQPKKIETSAI